MDLFTEGAAMVAIGALLKALGWLDRDSTVKELAVKIAEADQNLTDAGLAAFARDEKLNASARLIQVIEALPPDVFRRTPAVFHPAPLPPVVPAFDPSLYPPPTSPAIQPAPPAFDPSLYPPPTSPALPPVVVPAFDPSLFPPPTTPAVFVPPATTPAQPIGPDIFDPSRAQPQAPAISPAILFPDSTVSPTKTSPSPELLASDWFSIWSMGSLLLTAGTAVGIQLWYKRKKRAAAAVVPLLPTEEQEKEDQRRLEEALKRMGLPPAKEEEDVFETAPEAGDSDSEEAQKDLEERWKRDTAEREREKREEAEAIRLVEEAKAREAAAAATVRRAPAATAPPGPAPVTVLPPAATAPEAGRETKAERMARYRREAAERQAAGVKYYVRCPHIATLGAPAALTTGGGRAAYCANCVDSEGQPRPCAPADQILLYTMRLVMAMVEGDA